MQFYLPRFHTNMMVYFTWDCYAELRYGNCIVNNPRNTLLVDSSGYNCVVEGSVIEGKAWW